MPCRTPPSTWLDAVSGLTIRPTSWTATIRSTRTSPSAGVDRDLRDLAAERVHDEAVRVGAARAGAVDRRVAELLGHLGHVDVDRAVARADAAVARSRGRRPRSRSTSPASWSSVLRTFADGRAHGRHHRRRRLRAAGDGPVDVRAVSPPTTRTWSSGRPSSSAATICALVSVPVPMSWMPVTTMRVAVGVEPHRRVRRRPAAAPPDLRRAAHAAQEPVGLRLPRSSSRRSQPASSAARS